MNMEPLSEQSTQNNNFQAIARFTIGALVGLSAAGLYWGTSVYFDSYVSLESGIVGCVVMAVFCGIITMKWGYKAIEIFMHNLQ
jgi:hypothetical protein